MHDVLNSWLETHEIEDKDLNIKEHLNDVNINYKSLGIDAKLDLHLLNKEEALKALHTFFNNAVKKKYKKVLIIHGKGKHSKKGALLSQVVKEFLENHKNAGRRGHAKNQQGGSGATWVIIKGNKQT